MKNFIGYFVDKHLLVNFLFIGVLIGGAFSWYSTPKEEMPEFTFGSVRISVVFPGASASEVEYFVTKPIEQELKGIESIQKIESQSTQNSSTIRVELEKGEAENETLISEIRDAVYSVELPVEVDELPRIRQFKTSRKAIIDLALYFDDKELLSTTDRKLLQEFCLSLESRLVNIDKVNSVRKKAYYKEELQILLKPRKLYQYQIPISTVIDSVKKANIRQPAGTLENFRKDRVTVDGELRRKEHLKSTIIQGSFEGHFIRLSNIASVKNSFEKTSEILKINGREAIVLNVVKNSSVGILEAVDAVKLEIKKFQASLSPQSKFRVLLLDDESRDVRNRIRLISSNGLIGFILIILSLFLFLNLKTGIWVALGIPFTLSFTLIISNLFGFTVNNMTLAAVIIVMGMIVDDAIVVSENIMRHRASGEDKITASIEGTSYVLFPVVASITTTCVAFLPLLAYTGGFSLLSDSIPPIVAMVLVASLIESILILPAHLSYEFPPWQKNLLSLGMYPLYKKFSDKNSMAPDSSERSIHWFERIEEIYSRLLNKILNYKFLVILLFILFTFGSFLVYNAKMKFVLFPREETDQVFIRGEAPSNYTKLQTAGLVGKIEDVLRPYLKKDLVGYRTQIGHTGYRSSKQENKFRVRIELVNVQSRETPLRVILAKWKEEIGKIKGFKKISFTKSWFGSGAGSPIEIIVEENNDRKRRMVANKLKTELKKIGSISAVEIDEPYHSTEYRITPDRELARKLGVDASNLGSTLRTILEGSILYKLLNENSEEINVRLSVNEKTKSSINRVLSVPINNEAGYMLPIRNIVQVGKKDTPSEIQRLNNKRILTIYADMKTGTKVTPLELANQLEASVFPKLISKSPTTTFSYEGEIKNTKESRGFFSLAIITVLLLIFMILALQFNSLVRPLIIMVSIIPAVAFIIVVFWLHGMTTYGFFSIIGAMGLAGVVVNDAIILLKKLDDSLENHTGADDKSLIHKISSVASTRLKAVLLTTITTVAGLIPTAYGFTGYDAMLAEMMLALAWGLVFGTFITLLLVPSIYLILKKSRFGQGQALAGF